jgi:hypothetical protein
MTARPIGELIAPIMERAQRLFAFQRSIAKYPDPTDQKQFILMARDVEVISDDEARDLIAAYHLEAA